MTDERLTDERIERWLRIAETFSGNEDQDILVIALRVLKYERAKVALLQQEIAGLKAQIDALVTQLGDAAIEIARLEELLDEKKPSGTWVYPPKEHG